MTPPVAYVLIAAAVAGGLWSALLFVQDRRLHDRLFWLLAGLEVALIAELVAGSVALAVTDRSVDGPLFIGYLLTSAMLLPLAVAWAASEKTRWGIGVLFIACVSVAAVVERLLQVWQA